VNHRTVFMIHDEEFEVRQMFLEEAQDYIDAIEDGLLELNNSQVTNSRQHLDAVLRAAHSLKGGAAMMQFDALSQTAHRLEDSFKVMKSSKPIVEKDLELLLLRSVGLLRQISTMNRMGETVDRTWVEKNSVPIFTQLEQFLASAVPSEEVDTEEEANLTVLMFETEVENYLTDLETKLQDNSIQADDLQAIASDLSDIGQMLELDSFVSLSQTIIDRLQAEPDRGDEIARMAVKTWRRSQALVLTGNQDAIASLIEREEPQIIPTIDPSESTLTSIPFPSFDVTDLDLDLTDDSDDLTNQLSFAQLEPEIEPDLDLTDDLDGLTNQLSFAQVESETKLDDYTELFFDSNDFAPNPFIENLAESLGDLTFSHAEVNLFADDLFDNDLFADDLFSDSLFAGDLSIDHSDNLQDSPFSLDFLDIAATDHISSIPFSLVDIVDERDLFASDAVLERQIFKDSKSESDSKLTSDSEADLFYEWDSLNNFSDNFSVDVDISDDPTIPLIAEEILEEKSLPVDLISETAQDRTNLFYEWDSLDNFSDDFSVDVDISDDPTIPLISEARSLPTNPSKDSQEDIKQEVQSDKNHAFSAYIRDVEGSIESDRDVVSTIEELFEDLESGQEEDLPQSIPKSISNLVSAYIKESSVRLPVSQLDQLHDLSEELAIEHNSLDAQLSRLRLLSQTLNTRIRELEKTNTELSDVYDRMTFQEATIAVAVGGQETSTIPFSIPQSPFDTLELDRYNVLHSLSQAVMETIVKLEEVSDDIDLTLAEAEQNAASFTRNFRQLHNSVMQVRLRPISDVVGRFPRVVRNMALQYDKQVDVDIQGGETLIDRAVLEVLSDPLNHLLRNAFDHGIEDVTTRIERGKPAQGKIAIAASQKGDKTLISISDDGGGIDLEKVRSRVQQNLVLEGGNTAKVFSLSETELLSFIFEPGFSTSEQVTSLSGRGVGMDVVRTDLEKIGAEISINTKLGQGTTFTISIPFTLSSLRIMLLEVEQMFMAFPASVVREVIPIQSEAPSESEFHWGDRLLPIVSLSDRFRLNCIHHSSYAEDKPSTAKAIIVVELDNQFIAVPVDGCWGEQEVSIRHVEGNIPMPVGFSGCVILGSRQVVPLVDSELLYKQSDRSNPIFPLQTISPANLNQPDRILVVDDSVNVRRYLAIALGKAGYITEQAIDGEDALNILLGGLQISAVISDMEMPRIDGYALIARLRSEATFSDLPIIMLTSRSSEKHRQLAMNLGASAYLTKPYQENDLLHTLKGLLDA
jgi:chemotaxis protein histidine kinase CheA/CheY-like chemotaxis protein